MADPDDPTRAFQALVIGAGPAGLMAAERLSARGVQVLVADAKPSVGRKLLMAGKSGLNLTFDADADAMLHVYGKNAGELSPMIRAFDSAAIRKWAEGLGQDTFVGSSGRIFPTAMKASPLLRAWMTRLEEGGVEVATRWRWTGERSGHQCFDTPTGSVTVSAEITVLALGGASWARLGSDGQWAEILAAEGVPLAPFEPANAGLTVDWSPHMADHFGTAIKGAALQAGDRSVRGEFVISRRGLEGGGIYAVFSDIRDGADLTLDLLPDLSIAQVKDRLAKSGRKDSRTNRLRKALKLDKGRIALFNEFARSTLDADLPTVLKSLPVTHAGPRPIDEAISTAGGVAWDAVDASLMSRAWPGVYVAGEMLDWEAPTGGYLLTACLATGRWAGDAAADRLGLE
jgi:uncharacterized flavoprotein (TIGR03862 family)